MNDNKKLTLPKNMTQYVIILLVFISLAVSTCVYITSHDWTSTGTVLLACFGAIGIVYSAMTVAMMKEEKRPYVYVDYTLDPNAPTIIDVLIHNCGKTAAFDIKIKVDASEKEHTMLESHAIFAPLSDLSIFKNSIPFLPPDSERRVMYGPGHMISGYLPLEHKIKITYKDTYGKKFEENQIIEPSHMMNLSSADRADVHALNEITIELKELRKTEEDLSESIKIISGERKLCPCCKHNIITNDCDVCFSCRNIKQ